MQVLTEAQERLRNTILALLGDARPRSVLVYGPRGCGKSTMIVAIAEDLNLPLIFVDCSRSRDQIVTDVSDQLAAAAANLVLFVLDSVAELQRESIAIVSNICRRRRVDEDVGVNPDSPVIGILSRGDSRPLAPQISALFESQLELETTVTRGDVTAMLNAACVGSNPPLPPPGREDWDAIDLYPVLASIDSASAFAQRVVELRRRGIGTSTAMYQAARRAWDTWLARVVYMGDSPSCADYEAWRGQMSPAMRRVAFELVRSLVDKYYVNETAYWSDIDSLIQLCQVPDWSQVMFCRWQFQGESAWQVERDLKTRARWKVVASMDLDDEATWARCEQHPRAAVLMVDDFVGTGEQLVAGIERLAKLAACYPQTSCVVAVVAGFRAGFERAFRQLNPLPENVRPATARRYSSSDSCLSEDSTILGSPRDRSVLADATDELGKRLRMRFPRGYGGLASLVVFPRFIPNTCLPVLCHDAKPEKFRPLLPRSGWK